MMTDDDTTTLMLPGTVTWAEVRQGARAMADRWRGDRWVTGVYGVPTGGAPLAVMVADELGLPLVDHPQPGTLVVDDLVDTGATLRAYVEQGHGVDALYRKPWSPTDLCPEATLRDEWLRFPWERDDGAPVDAVVRLLQFIGEDPTRDGLADTPTRVVKAWSDLTSGYRDDVASILSTSFDVGYADNLVVVARVPFTSMCEHHMLPFIGHATLGYVPTDRVVGLSKLARLVDAFARRLQVQERLTMELVEAMVEHMAPAGAAAIVEGTHSCMSMRGIRKSATMITSHYTGTCNTPERRAEMLSLHRTG